MRKTKLLIATAILSAAMSTAVLAGEWKQDTTGWWYQNDDGGYTKSGWQTIDGKSYYFNESGYLLANTTTPDGYYVGADGAWVNNSGASTSVQLSTVTSSPSTVIGSGTYKVGTDIAAGEYVLFSTSDLGAYYEIASDSSGNFESIIDNDNFSYNAIVTVTNGQYLKLTNGTLSPISEVSQIDYTKGNMFKVGYHIPAGEYKLQSGSEFSGYCAVLRSSSGGVENIITNDNFLGITYMTVENGQYLQISRCVIVR